MRIRCDGCGEILLDQPLEYINRYAHKTIDQPVDESTVHATARWNGSRYQVELRDNDGRLCGYAVHEDCPEAPGR